MTLHSDLDPDQYFYLVTLILTLTFILILLSTIIMTLMLTLISIAAKDLPVSLRQVRLVAPASEKTCILLTVGIRIQVRVRVRVRAIG